MIARGQPPLTLTGVPDSLPRTALGKVPKHLLPKWEPTPT